MFGILWLLNESNPLWSTPEEPLPAEQGAYDRWLEAPGFLLRHLPAQAHLEWINARNWIDVPTTENFNRYINKYNKFTYSSRLGWTTRSGTRLDQCLLVNNGYRNRPEGDYYSPPDWPEDRPMT